MASRDVQDMETEQITPDEAVQRMREAARCLSDVDGLLAQLSERLAQAARDVAAEASLIPAGEGSDEAGGRRD